MSWVIAHAISAVKSETPHYLVLNRPGVSGSVSRVAWNLGGDPRWTLGGGTVGVGVFGGFGVGVSVQGGDELGPFVCGP